MIEQVITYGSQNISYQVSFSQRKTLDISVHPDQKITVKAPTGTPLEAIAKRVKHRAHWIIKQQQYFSQFTPRTPSRRYVGGETHLYLGRQYRLKIEAAIDTQVKLKGGYILIQTPQINGSETIKNILEKWYSSRAKIKFRERLNFCFTSFQKYGYICPSLQIRRLSKRWGSLTHSGKIILNQDLIRASTNCIDYVIIHELCHLKYQDHSPHFYEFLTLMMPDWEIRKHKLETLLS